MRTILLILSLLISIFNNSIGQTDTLIQKQKTENIAKKQAAVDTLSTKKTKKMEVKTESTNLSEATNAPSIVYIYKLKNRQLKSKFWYNPNEHVQPLDYYIEKGWSVVKMKKLEKPPLMEKLVALGQVLIPIVKDTLAKSKNSTE